MKKLDIYAASSPVEALSKGTASGKIYEVFRFMKIQLGGFTKYIFFTLKK